MQLLRHTKICTLTLYITPFNDLSTPSCQCDFVLDFFFFVLFLFLFFRFSFHYSFVFVLVFVNENHTATC